MGRRQGTRPAGVIPATLPGVAGEILVRWHPKMEGDDAGGWNARQRTVTLASDCTKPVQDAVFWHELTHSWLDDADVRLSGKDEERVCSAVALGLLCLQRAGYISFRKSRQDGTIAEGR